MVCLVTCVGQNIVTVFSTNGKLSNFLNEKCKCSFSICCSHSQCLCACVSSSTAGTAVWLATNTLMLLWLLLALGFSAMKTNIEVGHSEEDCCCHGTQRGKDRRKLALKGAKREDPWVQGVNNYLHHCCVHTPGSNSFLQHPTTLQKTQFFCFLH